MRATRHAINGHTRRRDPLPGGRTRRWDIRDIPRTLLHYAQIGDAVARHHFTTEQLIHTALLLSALLPVKARSISRSVRGAAPDLPVSVEIINLEREKQASAEAWSAACLAASHGLT